MPHPEQALTKVISQICSLEVEVLLLQNRVELLEHYLNQQSTLQDTLGNIMEELRKQEH